jgi:hypothetical protein
MNYGLFYIGKTSVQKCFPQMIGSELLSQIKCNWFKTKQEKWRGSDNVFIAVYRHVKLLIVGCSTSGSRLSRNVFIMR